MRKSIIVAILLSGALTPCLRAQTTYTDKLRKVEQGKGTVIIKQTEQIEQIVNNTVPAKPTVIHVQKEEKPRTHTVENKATESGKANETVKRPPKQGNYTARGRHKARGYRICIFTGGNSRADKTKAMQVGDQCRKKFPELSVYTNFVAPRWVTYVGDFRTRHDADKYVKLIRSARFTYEVRIVSGEVNLPNE